MVISKLCYDNNWLLGFLFSLCLFVICSLISVIDFCLTKHLVCDPVTNFTSLRLTWASHSNCKQRAGRAGRVKDGRVYRMVPQYFYEV